MGFPSGSSQGDACVTTYVAILAQLASGRVLGKTSATCPIQCSLPYSDASRNRARIPPPNSYRTFAIGAIFGSEVRRFSHRINDMFIQPQTSNSSPPARPSIFCSLRQTSSPLPLSKILRTKVAKTWAKKGWHQPPKFPRRGRVVLLLPLKCFPTVCAT